jgi:transposase
MERHSPYPTAASLDSQSVSTAVMVHSQVGYDGAKKLKGRKRFTLGLLLAVKVVAASVPERAGAKQLLKQAHQEQHLPHLMRIWVDGGYGGPDFVGWVRAVCWWLIEVVLRRERSTGFVVLPKRWVVERTYGWLHWCRRLNVDYERLPQSAESFIYIAMMWLCHATRTPHGQAIGLTTPALSVFLNIL